MNANRATAMLRALADASLDFDMRRTQYQPAGIPERVSHLTQVRTDEILYRAGLLQRHELHRDCEPFMVPSAQTIMREYLTAAGRSPGDHPMQTLTRALGTSDFPYLLENLAGKAATLGFNNSAEIWPLITRETPTKDYRQFSRITAPELPTLDVAAENAEMKYFTLGGDAKEVGQVQSHSAILKISRQAILNDTLGEVAIGFAAAGRAVSRTIGDAVLAVLTDNPTLVSDSTSLFDANHSNIGTSGAPSVPALDEIAGLMAAQTGPSGETLNIRPRYVVAGAGLLSTLSFLRSAMNAPDPSAQSIGIISTLTDARISGNGWYVLADPLLHDGIQIVVPESSSLFRFERHTRSENIETDAVNFLVGGDFHVLPVDYRSMAYNAGA